MFYDVSGVSGVSVGVQPWFPGAAFRVVPRVRRGLGAAARLALRGPRRWRGGRAGAVAQRQGRGAARGRLRRSQGSQGWELGKL